MNASVEVYSGTRYAERPVALAWRGQRLEVVEVTRRWQTPAGPGFDVTVTDGQQFHLQYCEVSDLWTVNAIA